MSYVTSNIRISKSLSAVIRDKIGSAEEKYSETQTESLLAELDSIAQKNAKYTKGFNSVKALRKIRYKQK